MFRTTYGPVVLECRQVTASFRAPALKSECVAIKAGGYIYWTIYDFNTAAHCGRLPRR